MARRYIASLPLENKLHIFSPPLNILYVFKSGYKIWMHSPPQFRSTFSQKGWGWRYSSSRRNRWVVWYSQDQSQIIITWFHVNRGQIFLRRFTMINLFSKIVVRKWEGNDRETTRKSGNNKLQPLVASIKTVLTNKNNNNIRCLHGWHRQVRKYSK